MGDRKQNIVFSANVKEFNSNINQAKNSIKTLNSELKLTQTQLKGNSTNVEALSRKIELLNEKYEEQKIVVENTKKKYEEAVKVYGENSKEAANLYNEYTKQEAVLLDLEQQIKETTKTYNEQINVVKKVGKALEDAGEKIKNAGDKITAVGNSLTKFGAVVGAGLVGITKSAIDFESAFTGVTKTVDGTAEQLQELRTGILQMSTEMPASANEIASVAEAAGQLGIKTEDVLSFSKVMMDLGNSTNLSADEAASALAKFANITGMSADNYSRLGSVVVDLGNNFATTESDIVAMATRLASTGELTGLTEAQIMGLATAMSSVGIEAEAGGSAMSKLLQKMSVAVETGKAGKLTLSSLAKTAGMSAKDFKKAFQEDSAGALAKFIERLNNGERNGKSAIAILQELGLTDVRLMNTILSLSNANGLMGEAVETANKAWSTNTALLTEANKRYNTTESKLEKMKNKFKSLAISLGDQVIPLLSDLLDNAEPLISGLSKAIEKFNKLDDVTKTNIVKFAALAVAIGPVVSGIGKVVSLAGSGISAIGKITSAVGSLSGALATGSTGLASMGSGILALASPTGLAVAGVVALTAAIAAYCVAQEKDLILLANRRKAIEQDVEAREQLIQKQKEQMTADLSEIGYTESLYNELKQITDENGKVKDGYEARAKFIVSELSDALGIEISLTDGVIEKYDELKNSIESVVLKKKAEIIMQAKEEAYTEAIKNRSQAYEELAELQQKAGEAHSKMWASSGRESMKAKMELEQLNGAIASQVELVNGYAEDIANYEYDLQLMQQGTTESIEELVNRNILAYGSETNSREENLKKQMEIVAMEIQTNKNKFDEMIMAGQTANAQIYQNQIDAEQNQLTALAESLVGMTNTVSELTPAQVEMWKLLADTSFMTYSDAINQMNPETAKEIQEITGTIAVNKTVETEAGKLGDRTQSLWWEEVSKMTPDTVATIAEVRGAIDTDTSVQNASGDMGIRTKDNFVKKADGENTGKQYDEGVKVGIENNQGPVFSAISSFAHRMLSMIASIFDSHSPSRETAKLGKYFVQGFGVGIDDEENQAIARVSEFGTNIVSAFNGALSNSIQDNALTNMLSDTELLNDGIVNNLSPKSLTVQFFPQQMTEVEMQRAEKYIREKWGAEVV